MPRIIIKEPDRKQQPYRLKINRIVTKIGRAKDNDILIKDGSSSTYHCKIKRVEGGFILVDLDSTNGIKYQGTRCSVIDLKDGETVQIGDDIDLKFSLSEEEIKELSAEDFESHQKVSFPKGRKPKNEEPSDDDDRDKEDKPSSKKKPSAKAQSKERHRSDDNDEENEENEDREKTRSKSRNRKKSSRSRSSSSRERDREEEDDDDDRDERPRRQQQEKSNASLSFVIFMILAILCFIAGLAIRHYLDHGTFIFTN